MTIASNISMENARMHEGASTPAGIRVRNLNRSYGELKVLDDVSFDVPEGGVCTLLGSSGSGKTTTLRLLAGLDRPDTGDITIAGQVMASDSIFVPGEQRQIGMVFQSYALWPHMKVFDQVAYPLKLRRWDKKRIAAAVDEAIRMVGLGGFLERFPAELSGGQQQRVAMARALVFGPRLLLLDEPMSGLDAELRRRTRLELEELQRRVKVTTVYVTHDQEEAMSVSDVVVVMSQGKVVSIASPRSVYDQPNSVYVASFVGASNLLTGTVTDISGDNVTVRLADGSLVTGIGREALSAGDTAICAIKPIDVVADIGGTNTNLIHGDVKSSTFLGPQMEILLNVSGEELRVPVPRWSTYQPGDRVSFHLPLERLSVLRKPG